MKTVIYGGSRKFINFINALTDGVKSFDEAKSAFEHVLSEGADALFILPLYAENMFSVDEFSEDEIEALAKIISGGKTKIYMENYPSYDYRDRFIFGIQARSFITPMGKNSLVLTESSAEELGFEILQKRSGRFYPNDVRKDGTSDIIVEVKNCIGAHKVVAAEERREGAALIKKGENLYVAMADITNLTDYEIFSYGNWRDFYSRIFGEILGIEESTAAAEFEKIYKKIEVRGQSRDGDRRAALECAVLDALSWHEKSGVILDGGKRGVYEMIRSFDLNIAKNIRGDSSMFTAALFMAAGKYFENSEYIRIAENITNHVLNERGLQIEEGKNKGLFRWFSGIFGLGGADVYVSDTSRVGNSLFALHKLGAKGLYDRLVSLGEALISWFGGHALLPICNFNYDRDDLDSIQTQERSTAPEFYDAPMIYLKNLYSITKDERYKEQILKTAAALAEIYPNYKTVTSHSDNFTYGRLLGVLAVAQTFGDGAWTPIINELLAYFEKLRHASGGFSDGEAYFDEKSLFDDMEFAVGFGSDNGNIADMVYCQNTLAYSLNILNSCEGGFDKKLTSEMFDGLTDFLLSTQITSGDKRFHGAWMRAFDMDGMEYYGCDKDFAWGPYCILVGWVTGTLPLIFLDILGLKTMY